MSLHGVGADFLRGRATFITIIVVLATAGTALSYLNGIFNKSDYRRKTKLQITNGATSKNETDNIDEDFTPTFGRRRRLNNITGKFGHLQAIWSAHRNEVYSPEVVNMRFRELEVLAQSVRNTKISCETQLSETNSRLLECKKQNDEEQGDVILDQEILRDLESEYLDLDAYLTHVVEYREKLAKQKADQNMIIHQQRLSRPTTNSEKVPVISTIWSYFDSLITSGIEQFSSDQVEGIHMKLFNIETACSALGLQASELLVVIQEQGQVVPRAAWEEAALMNDFAKRFTSMRARIRGDAEHDLDTDSDGDGGLPDSAGPVRVAPTAGAGTNEDGDLTGVGANSGTDNKDHSSSLDQDGHPATPDDSLLRPPQP